MFTRVKQMKTANFRNFKNYISEKEYGLKSKDSLTSILSTSDNTYKSITGVFGEKMSLFDDINIANVISDSDFDFNLLGKESTIIYLIVPDEDKIYYKLITIIVGMIYKELVKYSNRQENKKLDKEIDFILDEFANCPPLADIETIVSVARSRGMHFHFFIQSFSQLNNVYGKEVAQIILDNCGLIYLKTNTQETADAISKRLGKKTIESNSVRQSTSLINYNGDRSTNLIGRDLMTPEEVKQLHYKTIIFPVVGFPIFRDTIMYNKFRCYKKGYIERKIIPLKDLSYTYYTVEDIKLNKKEDDIDINLEMQDNDKLKLKTLEPNIKRILKNDYHISYEVNEQKRVNLLIKLERKISLNEKILLNNKIKNEYFHVEVKENENLSINFNNIS